MSTKNAVIAGSGWSSIARRSTATLAEHVLEACGNALADTGLSWSDVDGIATYPSTAGAGGLIEGIDSVGVEYLAQTLGLRNVSWYASLEKGTVGHVLAAAMSAVETGQCRVAVVWKAMHTPKTAFGSFSIDRAPGESQFRAPYGMGGPYNAGGGAVSEFALPYSQYLARYGRDRLEMGPHIVQNRDNAATNPSAVFAGKPITESDWINDTMVSTPLSMLDCDMSVDGAGAVVIVSGDLAGDLASSPVRVAGRASVGIHFMRAPSLIWDDLEFNATRICGLALERAGVRAGDVTSAALYDGFSYFVPLWLESAGFCDRGEAFDYIREGNTARNSRLPVNVLGGNLGMGRLHGMPQIIEGVRQVQGRAYEGQSVPSERAFVTIGNATHGAAAFVLEAHNS